SSFGAVCALRCSLVASVTTCFFPSAAFSYSFVCFPHVASMLPHKPQPYLTSKKDRPTLIKCRHSLLSHMGRLPRHVARFDPSYRVCEPLLLASSCSFICGPIVSVADSSVSTCSSLCPVF